jgi:hypothetical protein
MARRKSNPDEPKPTKATQRAQSKAVADVEGIDREVFDKLAKVWFQQEDVLETYQGEYMNRCKGPRGVQAAAIDVAKKAGFPITVARAKLALMTLDRKKERVRQKLEPVDLSLLNRLEKARKELGALADTELGQAHLKQLQDDNAAAVDALAGDDPRPQFLKDRHDQTAENVAWLTGPDGIKQLEEPL